MNKTIVTLIESVYRRDSVPSKNHVYCNTTCTRTIIPPSPLLPVLLASSCCNYYVLYISLACIDIVLTVQFPNSKECASQSVRV